jgi:hypothetical protein
MGCWHARKRAGTSEPPALPIPIDEVFVEKLYGNMGMVWVPARAGSDQVSARIWRVTGLGAPVLVKETAELALDDEEWVTGEAFPEYADYQGEIWTPGSIHLWSPVYTESPP